MSRRWSMALVVGIAGSAIATGQTPTRFATLSGVGLEGNTNGTWAVTSGDVNGDGARDIIVADYTSGESQLWLNDGHGHFEVSAGLNGLKQEVYAVTLEDVDGDGDLDLMCGAFDRPLVRLLRNDGQGKFTDVTSKCIPDLSLQVRGLSHGDVDGDRDRDVFIACANGGHQVLLNDGKGVFSSTAAWPVRDGESGEVFCLGDIDADGDLDAVLAHNNGANGMTVFLSDGKTFHKQVHLETSDSIYSLELIDVDDDGDLDLLSGVHEKGANGFVALHLKHGEGGFDDRTQDLMPKLQLKANSLTVGDVDEDGDLDVIAIGNGAPGITEGNGTVLLNDGHGKFTEGKNWLPPLTGSGAKSCLADFDGDGDLDLFYGSWGGTDTLLFNLSRQVHVPMAPKLGKPCRVDFYARTGLPLLVRPFATRLRPNSGTAADEFSRQLLIDPDLIALGRERINGAKGVVSVVVKVPDDPALVGKTLVVQGIVLDAPFRRPTNVAITKIGR